MSELQFLYHILLIKYIIDRNLGCFCLLSIILLWRWSDVSSIFCFQLFEYMPRVELLDGLLIAFKFFEKTSCCFPEQLRYFYVFANSYENFSFLFLPNFPICHGDLKKTHYFNSYEVWGSSLGISLHIYTILRFWDFGFCLHTVLLPGIQVEQILDFSTAGRLSSNVQRNKKNQLPSISLLDCQKCSHLKKGKKLTFPY